MFITITMTKHEILLKTHLFKEEKNRKIGKRKKKADILRNFINLRNYERAQNRYV